MLADNIATGVQEYGMPNLPFDKRTLVAFVGLGVMGCSSLHRGVGPRARDALALSLPSRIEIVDPFTRIKNLSGGDDPDGVEVLVQAVGAMDNAGLLLVGSVRVELFEYMPGSADQTGRRLEQWGIDLATDRQQRTYWNRLTQMYEFRLGADLRNIPKSEAYVLRVTFMSPLGQRLDDEIVLSRKTGLANWQ